MAGGIVAPVNTALIPNYANIFEGLKIKAHNSMDGVPYGVPHGRGPNLLMYNTEVVTTAPTSWDSVWSGEYGDKVSIYDSSDYIADAALHLMATKPDLGITNPYQLNDAQFAAAIALLEKQRDAGAQYWSVYTDQMAPYAAGDVVTGTSWQLQANLLQAERAADRGDRPGRGLHRLVRHLDDPLPGQEPRTACTCGWTTWHRPRRTGRPRSTSAKRRRARPPVTTPRRSRPVTAN